MLIHAQKPTGPISKGQRCRCLSIAAYVGALLVVGSGCGTGHAAARLGAEVEVITGKDSAGATIELERRGAELSRARVIDVILGTGEAEIVSGDDAYLEFTIRFPTGVTITYVGTVRSTSASSTEGIAGTWRQHAAGIFAEDEGTWSAPEVVPDS